MPGAENWNNELCWTPEDGEYVEGLPHDATLEDRIVAAFHEDAEIIDGERLGDPKGRGR